MVPLDTLDDAQLVLRSAHAGLDGVEELYERHRQHALSVARSVLGDENAAEDVVQDVFVSLPRMAASFDPARGGAVQWLLRSVRNRAIDALRREKRRRSPADVPEASTDPDRDPDALDPVGRGYLRDVEVVDLVARLDVRHAQLVRLAFLEGWSHSAIAGLTDLPLGTVKGRIRLALQLIRALIAEADVTPRDEEGEAPPGRDAASVLVLSADSAWTQAVRDVADPICDVEVSSALRDVSPAVTPDAVVVDTLSVSGPPAELLARVDHGLHSDRAPAMVRSVEGLQQPEERRRGLTVQAVAPSGLAPPDLQGRILSLLSASGARATSDAATARLLDLEGEQAILGDSVGRILRITPRLAALAGVRRGSVNDLSAMPRSWTERRWRDFADRGWWQGSGLGRSRSGEICKTDMMSWMLPDNRFAVRVEQLQRLSGSGQR